ncbi:MAG: DNA-directed DNA polymerase I [Candidatus Thorarchaeota archaeon]
MEEEQKDPNKKQSSLEDFFGSGSKSQTSSAKKENSSHKKESSKKPPSEIPDYENGDSGEEEEAIDSNELEEIRDSVLPTPSGKGKPVAGQRDEPKNLGPSYLLSVDYAGHLKKAFAQLYDAATKKIYLWYDNTDHKPYCYTDFPPQVVQSKVGNHKGFVGTQKVEVRDLLRDEPREMTKIIADDPLSIGGGKDAIRDVLIEHTPDMQTISHAWEAAIRYRNCYTYDREIIPGLPYVIENGELIRCDPKVDEDVLVRFKKMFKAEKGLERIIDQYAPMFFTEVPDIRRLAVDIEVYAPIENRIPDPMLAEQQITAIGLADNESYNKCFVLRRRGHPEGKKSADYPKELDVVFFEDETEMLIQAFRVMDTYPIVLSFVGDSFDLTYLYNRANRLKIDLNRHCPIRLGRDIALMRGGVHIDLYRFLKNPSIRLYALSGAYERSSLEAIGQGLLGIGKLELSDSINKLPYYELAHYCWLDSKITMQITQYEYNLLLRLIILLMRISRLSMEDVTRLGISSWIQSLFRQEHRSRNYLIPQQYEIQLRKSSTAQTEAIIKDKAFKGAIVIEPVPGVHFDATVLDFASLYPTIMKTHNISYETVDCPHDACKSATNNRVPETNHWTCTLNKGMISETIGFFRDTRVNWFKEKSKDKSLDDRTRNWYSVVEKALKVFVNASYGVTGAQHFELFCMPAAESVTAYGRDAIIRTKEKAESMGVRVIYGDTDSVFLDNPSKEQQDELVKWSSKELGIDLEVEKTYKYVALSERKKNYIGVYKSGYVEVKGLSGKKRNTPFFAQKAFQEMLDVLAKVDSPKGFEVAREEIKEIVHRVLDKLEGKAKEYPPDELAFRVQLTKPLNSYGDSKPQHVRAAILSGEEVGPGSIIEYIKTKDNDGVVPLNIARKQAYWIDKDKYIDTLKSVFEQVLDAVGLDFEGLMGFTTLDQFF